MLTIRFGKKLKASWVVTQQEVVLSFAPNRQIMSLVTLMLEQMKFPVAMWKSLTILNYWLLPKPP
ncbi:MAG: hypothetical protein A2700_01385 [Candidatus Blackburnbacteria bacterium RIFCSPHIGHO2_01_FULL_44_64]|uniref:Uncharacterized protein n=1 Tax=Candidatus Blackburnbacteria bacterium RIFCSPHIGHO2_02_FULL_44_20 TaxID=1797516 RepID=A0A1G1V4Q5_9BACT|nr:MAG: hypothetical protein A2700_01385 [Candidatus Blackburnbacteria bacterium RIFCSPHIGHO2_01_FULL_44_64]OGY10331.1 MAG: hypothetical protein A3D26_03460 [Candidatus Blackburnbacteria bacterium RIFCSPHIGHO2_02_FULL_44_20]OGY11971.1 MAG: hypothetical protein A3E16_02080 [Candidatus Blackburnbacteria bacterium RIFCSPHIGHO2_12_FULL_44_25]OGY14821.1 MAG: hypothetical protein A3A62_03470 [Candidatus Blackburnbacteria bacterium RIFCSPLOWO2_01_FULL_44_43]